MATSSEPSGADSHSSLPRKPSTVRVVRSAEKEGRPGLSIALVVGIVVVVAIGYHLLTSSVTMTVTNVESKGLVGATLRRLGETAKAVELFRLNHGRLPDRLEDLVLKPESVNSVDWPSGGYLRSLPRDGWGKELQYRTGGPDGTPFQVVSLGSDGRPGGTGLATDLTQP